MASGIITLLAALVAVVKGLYDKYWSPAARLAARQLADAERQGREAVEKERLQATYDRINAEKDKSGQDLVNDLNRPRT